MLSVRAMMVACLALVLGLAGGCTPAKQDATKAAAPAEKQEPKPAGLAELSPEDRAAAEKQKICPVSGEPLGSMGKPVKVTVKGQTVFLCCAGCEDAIKKDPDKYLAKLKK